MSTFRVFLAAFVLLATLCVSPAIACDSSSPDGLYKGEVTSSQAGKLNVTLNLRCESGHYAGLMVTPVGKFSVTAGDFATGKLRLTLGEGAGSIVAELEPHGTDLDGKFHSQDDAGPIALNRVANSVEGDFTKIDFKLSPEQWRQDLASFAEQMQAKHGAPFHRVSRDEFDHAVSALSARIAGLDRDAIYVELDRLATMIGDGHTFVMIPPDPAQMPVLIRRFGSDYRIVATTAGYERALGGKILSIDHVPIVKAAALALGPTPGDETDALRRDRTAYFLSLGMMLHGLGITPARDVATYTLRFDDGRTAAVEMQALPQADADPDWHFLWPKRPLYRQHDDQSFWCVPLQQGKTVYCNFNAYDDLAARSARLFDLLKGGAARRVVIDMRLNSGGDFNEGEKYVIDPLAKIPQINRRGGIYVLIGRSVFSAGMSNAAQFRSATHAILVGEPIGERPNSWQEAREFTLPNSHLVVRYSTKFYRFAPKGQNLIAPDVDVAPTWHEYSTGADPVLEWALRQPSR